MFKSQKENPILGLFAGDLLVTYKNDVFDDMQESAGIYGAR